MISAPQNPLNTQVLYLDGWPPLRHLLGDAAPHITRICALLARRPSVGMLIPVILHIPPHIVHPLLETLYAQGCIRPAASAVALAALAPIKAEPAPAPSQEPTSDISFLTKLWQYLINKKDGQSAPVPLSGQEDQPVHQPQVATH